MKRLLAVSIGIGLMAAVGAQDRAQPNANAFAPVQAPPALNDPGDPNIALPSADAEVKSALSNNDAGSTTVDSNPVENRSAENKPIESDPLPPEVQAAANAAELPVITVRQRGADTVEEYRKHGKLYFVRVLNASGPTRYYVDNPNAMPPNMMQQLSGPSGTVQPVYFKIADWK
jgi:hypothetical protein